MIGSTLIDYLEPTDNSGKLFNQTIVGSTTPATSYIFYMGSLILIQGFSNGSAISTSTTTPTGDILIPYYCPVYITGASPQMTLLPTLIAEWMSVTNFSSSLKVNSFVNYVSGGKTTILMLPSLFKDSVYSSYC